MENNTTNRKPKICADFELTKDNSYLWGIFSELFEKIYCEGPKRHCIWNTLFLQFAVFSVQEHKEIIFILLCLAKHTGDQLYRNGSHKIRSSCWHHWPLASQAAMDTKWVPRQSDIKGQTDTWSYTSIASWWCCYVETLSSLLALCEDNPQVTSGFNS